MARRGSDLREFADFEEGCEAYLKELADLDLEFVL